MNEKWSVKRYFRSAYHLSVNGIIERHYRTIKAVAEKSQISPQEAVFWYNMALKTGQDEVSVPRMVTSTSHNGKSRKGANKNHIRRGSVGETTQCSVYYTLGKRNSDQGVI